METLILGWYVLVETDSVLLLTLFGALQFGGTLVAPAFGVAGDRIGHRNLLCGMRVFYTILSTTLMSIAFVGATNPTIVLMVTALMGLVRPSDLGVRSALIAELHANRSADASDGDFAHDLRHGTRGRRTDGRRAVCGIRHGAGLHRGDELLCDRLAF